MWYIIEQPHSTLMYGYPAFVAFRQRYPSAGFGRLDMGAYGGECPKATLLFGNAPYLGRFCRRMTPEERRGLEAVQTSVRYVDSAGRVRSTGTKELKATQAYPLEFGAAHAVAYRDCRLASASSSAPASASASAGGVLPEDAARAVEDAWWLQDFVDGDDYFDSRAAVRWPSAAPPDEDHATPAARPIAGAPHISAQLKVEARLPLQRVALD